MSDFSAELEAATLPSDPGLLQIKIGEQEKLIQQLRAELQKARRKYKQYQQVPKWFGKIRSEFTSGDLKHKHTIETAELDLDRAEKVLSRIKLKFQQQSRPQPQPAAPPAPDPDEPRRKNKARFEAELTRLKQEKRQHTADAETPDEAQRWANMYDDKIQRIEQELRKYL